MTSSVLITNYNYARFLRVAINSVVQQTAPVCEVVIVDDGSTDDSRTVIDALVAERPGVIISVYQPNGGQAAAFNAGFARCHGEIVHLLDADDLWDQSKLERVEAAFVENPSACMVMHRLRHVDSNGAVLRDPGCGRRPGGDLSTLMLSSGGAWVYGATSSLSLRRSALETILPISTERWRLCADGAIAYPAAFLGAVVSLDDVLGGYRIHGANNHYAAGLQADKVQADIEMTNRYLNDFLARIGRPERVDLEKNLSYRRDRFYRHGGGPLEALAITKLIATWPLYHGPLERARFMARFFARYLTGHSRTRNNA